MNNLIIDYHHSFIRSGDNYLKYQIENDQLIIQEQKGNTLELKKILVLIAKYHKLKTIIDQDEEIILADLYIKRAFKIGDLACGSLNSIVDVEGVSVGMDSVKEGNFNTGLTVIFPHQNNLFREKVIASTYVFNGFGKSVGLVQIEELGSIETPIAMTSTLNVGKVLDAMQEYMLKMNEKATSINPIVLECNDGSLNDARKRIIDSTNLAHAIINQSKYVEQGDVGAGSGMMCHGFKGGIGTSSRTFTIDKQTYTLSLILNSNFGSANGEELIIKGRRMKPFLDAYLPPYFDQGSIVGVVATDLPLSERQLKRILKRVELGIARTGSYAGSGSGDLFIGFSTQNKITEPFNDVAKRISDNDLNIAFKAVVECSEEAVLNSMIFAHPVKGYQKNAKGLMEYLPAFVDLLDLEIIKKEK